MSLRAVIWCAVSSIAQANEGKDSLTNQEQQGKDLCKREGWDIVATLIVPGHSRYYIDIHDVARDMAAQGIDAFNRLIALWEQKAFDVLIVRDGDRFARTQTLHSYVVERTISVGAKIYSFHDGWIDEYQAPMFIAMSGYKTKMDMTRLIEYKIIGMPRRIAKGLHSNHTPSTHKTIRDINGKAIKLVLDETQRPYWDDVATLLLQGVGWNDLCRELSSQFGYPDYQRDLWTMVHNPYFWGHSALGHFRKGGEWAYEWHIEPPASVTVFRDTHEAVYTGELAEKVKAELRRRRSMKGKRSPTHTHRFSGLIVCDYCHTSAIIATRPPEHRYYKCNAKAYRIECPSHTSIREEEVQRYMDLYLQEFDKRATKPGQTTNSDEDKIERLRKEHDDLEKKMGQLITDKAESPTDGVRAIYSQKILEHSQRIAKLETQIRSLAARIESPEMVYDRRVAYSEIMEMKREVFWTLSSTVINQMLHRILGKRRLRLRDGKIVGTRE